MKIINPEIIEPDNNILRGGGTVSCDDCYCYCYTCSNCYDDGSTAHKD